MFTFGTCTIFAANKSSEIKAKGNNDLYKARTEKAAMSVEGISKADWSKETKKLAVEFDETKTDIDKIEIAIANVGHDTLNHKAKEEVYNKLPDECKYREKEKTE